MSNSSACEDIRTVSAKINDSVGLGMGRVYVCKRFQIDQLVKIKGPSQLKSMMSWSRNGSSVLLQTIPNS